MIGWFTVVPLNRHKYAVIDIHSRQKVSCFKWYEWDGYAVRGRRSGKRKWLELMHRTIMDAQPGQMVDHINGNGRDNRLINLRFCDKKQNAWNMKTSRSKCGYKGIYFWPSRNKWKAHLMQDGKQITIGYYDSLCEAIMGYNSKVIELRGEFAVLNPLPA